MSEIRTVDFDSMPKGVRERLVACFAGQSSPAPLIMNHSAPGCSVVGWMSLLAASIVVALAVIASDFGAFNSSIPPVAAVVVYGLLFFLLFVSMISTARALWAKKSLPFKPGVYLLPCDLVDARTRFLRIVPTRLLSNLQVVHHLRNGVYQHTMLTFAVAGGGSESLTVLGKEAAESQVNALWRAQQTLSRAAQAQDWQTLWWADPFFDQKASGAWEAPPGPEREQPPRCKAVPWPYRQRALLAGGLALAAAPALLGLRIVVNDHLSITLARQTDKEWSWQSYLAVGYFHVEEAKQRLPVAALREAKAKGSVSAVREVLKKYPGSSIEKEARAHLHSLYEKTLSDFRQKATGRDPAMLDFMGRLIAYLEGANVTTLRVVFKPPTAEKLADVDSTLASKFAKIKKDIAPIAPHFDQQRVAGRQTAIVSKLNQAFGQIFPTDVMHLESGPTAAVSEPALEIGYAVRPSGDLYTSEADLRAYVGIVVDFEMTMRVPGDPKTFGFAVQVEPPDRFSTSKNGDDQVVYDTMTERAFDELNAKLETVFFGAPATAAEPRAQVLPAAR